MLEAFGAIMMFTFIEASKPFTSKKAKRKDMTLKDRDELVKYWAINGVPVESMFQLFNLTFAQELGKVDSRKYGELGFKVPVPKNVQKGLYYEMPDDQFNECLSMLKRSYPDYNDLESAKNKFMNEINKSEVSQ